MGPEVKIAMMFMEMISKMGGWSIGGIFIFLAIAPAIFIYLAARVVAKALNSLKNQLSASEMESQKRFQAFSSKYDNNIRFVEDYERLASGLDDTLRRNTVAMTKLIDRIDTMKGIT